MDLYGLVFLVWFGMVWHGLVWFCWYSLVWGGGVSQMTSEFIHEEISIMDDNG